MDCPGTAKFRLNEQQWPPKALAAPLRSQYYELREEFVQADFGLPWLIIRRVALALSVPVVIIALLAARVEILRRRQPITHVTQATSQPPLTSLSATQAPEDGGSSRPSEPLDVASKADPASVPAQSDSSWKSYTSSEYGFEIKYPADWEFSASYENNYGKPPSGHGPPAYAGETCTLFDLELDGPDQPQDGGGDFEDGAIIEVQITGTSGVVENWNITRDRPVHQYVETTTPADWVKLHTSVFSGDVENIAVDTNGFKGAIQVACNGTDTCKVFGEEGGAYRLLPSGRLLLISWERG